MKNYIKIVAFGIGLIVTSSMLFSQGVYSGGNGTVTVGSGLYLSDFTFTNDTMPYYFWTNDSWIPYRTNFLIITNRAEPKPFTIENMDQLIDYLAESGRICVKRGHCWTDYTIAPRSRKCQLCNKIQYKKEIWE